MDMMVAARGAARRGLLLLVVFVAAAAAAVAQPLLLGANSSVLSVDFHAASCPQLESIVRGAVQAARGRDVQVTAGLLRIFFHDCFPQGSDASILLEGGNSERQMMPQNQGLQPGALQLIEDIRAMVHAQCGPTVSCADIIVLATRDAVNLAGGPFFSMPLGRLDSFAPASRGDVSSLPRPDTADVGRLIDSFKPRGLCLDNAADLVALSGAHTVGRARCGSFADRTARPNDDFTRTLAGLCAGDPNRQQNLDVISPDTFDNSYFVDLRSRQGVLTTDQGLLDHPSTGWLVRGFADNRDWFFGQFANSMIKLSQFRGPQGNVGEIRRNSCFRRNAIQLMQQQDSAADDEAQLLAASA